MEIKKIDIKKIFKQFDRLDTSFIDASSMIYLKRINLLGCLSNNLKLFSINEILNETGFNNPAIEIYKHDINENTSNDEKLVICSIREKLPIITEDKKVLNLAKKAKIEYYNSLMILNYLLYKDFINVLQYDLNYNHLIGYAWYSKKVIEYGKLIYKKIILQKDRL